MKNLSLYLLTAGLVIALAVLGIAAMRVMDDAPEPVLGQVRYLWAGAAVVLVAIIWFFIWLAAKGRN